MFDPNTHPELGRPLATHGPNYWYAVRKSLGWGLMAAAGVACILVGLHVIDIPRQEGLGETLACFGMGGVFLACGLFFVFDTLRSTGPKVVVYERGFVAGAHTFAWERIVAVYQLKLTISMSGLPIDLSEYTIRRDDGRELRFTGGVRRVAELVTTIQEQVNPRLLASARAAFAAGRDVDFDAVSVDANGLRFVNLAQGGLGEIDWDHIDDIVANGMTIAIRKRGGSRIAWYAGTGDAIATRKVANVHVFLTLVSEILATQHEG